MEMFLGGLIILLGFSSALAYVPLQIYTGLKLRWLADCRIGASLVDAPSFRDHWDRSR